jgi:2-polyprenyl-3-methyl-5-hydroxy-6-metoxy-1,4-benzoquinol methylase
MIDLRRRSYQKELMDAEHIPFADIAQTLKELNVINTRLGGHAITVDGVRQLMVPGQPLVICEIGCGGGDNLHAIQKFCKKNNIPARFIGIDMNPECIAFAKQQYPDLDCEWIASDYAVVNLQNRKPDIIFSSLFCHHFTDDQLVQMLQWQQANSRRGFFINDLHRHWLAYYLIKYITKFFSKSRLVRHDASLSVARSFREKDWRELFKKAGIPLYHIRWRWAFRFLVTGKNQNE